MAEVDGFQRGLGTPFAPGTYAATGGSPLRIVVVDGADGVIRIFRPDGTLERLVQTNIAGVPPSAAATASWESQTRARWARSMSEETINRLFSELPRPATLPLVTGVNVTSDNEVWLETSVVDGDHTAYLVYAMTGELLGTVLLPTGFDAFDFWGSQVVGRMRDAMDVQTVVVLQVEITEVEGP